MSRSPRPFNRAEKYAPTCYTRESLVGTTTVHTRFQRIASVAMARRLLRSAEAVFALARWNMSLAIPRLANSSFKSSSHRPHSQIVRYPLRRHRWSTSSSEASSCIIRVASRRAASFSRFSSSSVFSRNRLVFGKAAYDDSTVLPLLVGAQIMTFLPASIHFRTLICLVKFETKSELGRKLVAHVDKLHFRHVLLGRHDLSRFIH